MPYFLWVPAARAALRAIPKPQARQILAALTEYAETQQGDVAALHGKLAGRLRLRCSDYRVIFRRAGTETYQVLKVGHRRDIYQGE
jgi:mRNA-degrading endonuclease RelE of RelBE toxin-antitoxin system